MPAEKVEKNKFLNCAKKTLYISDSFEGFETLITATHKISTKITLPSLID